MKLSRIEIISKKLNNSVTDLLQYIIIIAHNYRDNIILFKSPMKGNNRSI